MNVSANMNFWFYFVNSIYHDGWTYKNNGLGNPYLITKSFLEGNYDKDEAKKFGPNTFINNRVKAYQVKINYGIGNISASTIVVFSNNLGNYGYTMDLNSFSFSNEIKYKYKKSQYFLNIGIDSGLLWQNALGAKMGYIMKF